MYGSGFINDFIGRYDSGLGEYVLPDAPQNLVITFTPPAPETPFYLSANDGDFTTDGVTIISGTGESEDITVGNAIAKVLNTTMLNPSNSMGSLTWGDGAVYIGVETASGPADTWSSLPVVIGNMGLDTSGNAHYSGSTYTLGGEPVAVISDLNGTDVLYITDTKIGRYSSGSFSVVTTPDASQQFLAEKYRALGKTIGIRLDENGCPYIYNSVEMDTKQTFSQSYIPMGIFDFSNVDAHEIVFGVEAYDKMTLFDVDATAWLSSLDFTTPKTISDIITALMTEIGMTASIDANAVNTSMSYSYNPIAVYSVTFRQVLKWLAEAIGCNVRIGRTGLVEFFPFLNSSRITFTPDIIIGGSRITARYSTPYIDKVVCYDTLGIPYTSSGIGDDIYYIVANPFLDTLDQDLTPIDSLKSLIRNGVRGYKPTTFSMACSYPGTDAGDYITCNETGGGFNFIPVMHQTLTWSGRCMATIVATGKQKRMPPDGEITTLGGSVGNNNPVASRLINCNKLHIFDPSDPSAYIDILPDGPTPTTASDSTSVASDTSWHTIEDFTISSPGTYLISIHANFPSSATGRRQMILSTSQDSSSAVARRFMESKNAVNGTATYLNLTSVVAVSASTTYHINVQQNSGSSMSVTWEYSYVRLA